MATRMQQRRGTAAEWTSADPVLASGEIGYETDTNKFKFGDGVTAWSSLEYFTSVNDLVDGAPDALNTLNELAAALNDDEDFGVTVLNELSLRAYMTKDTQANWDADTNPVAEGLLAYDTTNTKIKLGDGGSTFVNLPYIATEEFVSTEISTATGGASSTELGYVSGVTSSVQTQLDALATDITANTNDIATNATAISTAESNISSNSDDIVLLQTDVSTLQSDVSGNSTDIATLQGDLSLKANIDGPTFSGTVSLPATTSIGDVDSAEIGHLNGVTSAIQTQLDGKLESSVASTTYAPLANATLSGTVSLPNTTSIGDVSSTEISYLDGVTSSIQTQLDSKAPTESPTFTGTVSGVTKAMVGLGNVENTADADKPVSTAQAAALALKADLSGATFSGDVTVETNLVVDGNLTISGTTTTVNATDLVVSDPLIYIGEGNAANLVDLGLVSSFNDGTYQHSGIVRDASDDKWKLFKGVTDEPTTVVNFAQGSLDDLAVNSLEAASVVFPDGSVQTKAGVPSLTSITEKTASYTLDTLSHQDNIVEMNSSSAVTFSIPTDVALAWPVGASMDIFQTGTGQVTIDVVDSGTTTLNYTPGNKLRTQWSSATILKRGADSWVIYGDLTA